MRVRVVAYIWIVWALNGAPVWGQDGDPPRLEAIWTAYQRFDYVGAQQLAQAALETYQTPEALAQVHIILGLIAFSQNEQGEADRQFTSALVLNPRAELDSLLVSPKILAEFDEIRAELSEARSGETVDTGAPPRYILVPDRRAEAALRSMILPGWGQLYKGQRVKGRVLMGAWGLVVVGSVTAHVLRQEARTDYLSASTPDEALVRYDTFDRWHKTRNALVLGAVGIWIYGYLDALVSGNRLRDQRDMRVTPAFSGQQMYVSIQVRF